VGRVVTNPPVSKTPFWTSPFAANQVVDLLFSITFASRKVSYDFGLQVAIDNSETDDNERRKVMKTKTSVKAGLIRRSF
jgi:hypothetical protein